jgi:hypothetical protein
MLRCLDAALKLHLVRRGGTMGCGECPGGGTQGALHGTICAGRAGFSSSYGKPICLR